MKHKQCVPKIVVPALLLGAVCIAVKFGVSATEARTAAWYAPLTGITYHSEPGTAAESDNVAFSLDANGGFELVRGESTCCGQFEKELSLENKVLDPQQNLYSFSFRTPCSTHDGHALYFTIYPNDLNSFVVSVEMDTEAENLWLTADNSDVITLSAPSASDGDAGFINLEDCHTVLTDADGNVVTQTGTSSSFCTIPINCTMYYYNPSGSGFAIAQGSDMVVSATMEFSDQYHWDCGYSSTGDVSMGSGNARSIAGNAKCPATDSYCFYIRNNSAQTMTITSGAISY